MDFDCRNSEFYQTADQWFQWKIDKFFAIFSNVKRNEKGSISLR